MLGYIGIAPGAMMVLFPLPIVQIFWLGALGFAAARPLAGRRAARVEDRARPSRGRRPSARSARQRRAGARAGPRAAQRRAQRAPQAKEASLTQEETAMATEGQTLEQQLEELLDQETFPPPDGFKEQAVVSDAGDLRAGRGLRGVLGRARRGAALGHQVGPGARLVEPAVRQVVRRRQAQRLLQLRRPPRRGRQRRPRRLPLAR